MDFRHTQKCTHLAQEAPTKKDVYLDITIVVGLIIYDLKALTLLFLPHSTQLYKNCNARNQVLLPSSSAKILTAVFHQFLYLMPPERAEISLQSLTEPVYDAKSIHGINTQ